MEEKLKRLTAIVEQRLIPSSQKNEALELIDDIAEELI